MAAATHPDPVVPSAFGLARKGICAQCGSTAYDYPDMVGVVCPECWQENQLIEATAKAAADAEAAREQLAERRADRKAAAKRSA